MPLPEFEIILGVKFKDPLLLQRALTHRSYVNETDSAALDNERLEFLGDAVLDFVAAEMLYRRFPDLPEGDLTQLRAALVRMEALAQMAGDVQLGDFLLIGKGEEANGGRARMTNLGRAFEAIIGAVYMDSGITILEDFLLPRLDRLLSAALAQESHKDARSIFQERAQAELHFTPQYRVAASDGPEHDVHYRVEVFIYGLVVGTGTGTSKRAASQMAAQDALHRVTADGWHPELLTHAQMAAAAQRERDRLRYERQAQKRAQEDGTKRQHRRRKDAKKNASE
jgi:ribonuclease III